MLVRRKRIVGALEFITMHKHGRTLAQRPPIDKVKLVATDLDWSYGVGDEISGPAESIMIDLAARPVLGELSGVGVKHWQ